MPAIAPTSPSNPRVTFETTEGRIVCELFPNEAPVSVANFLKYAKEGYYKGLIFHRVIKGFMIQGGGYEPNGRQKKATHAPIKLEVTPKLEHWDGALALARTSDPNSATCQFYICHGAQRGLNMQYAVFGLAVEGKDVVDRIASTPTDRADKPRKDVVITNVTVQGA